MKFDRIILASASPRRQELLKMIFDGFEIIPADVDETVGEEVPVDLRAEKIARRKARFIASNNADALVIGCDTAVIIKDKMLGKPKDRADAEKMLCALSGETHKVITGCCLCFEGKEKSFSAVTEVEFYPLGEEELEKYLDTNDWADKAGAYGIQNMAGLFVRQIKGEYNNVVGLPTARLYREIKEL
ncbi:MAG: septum formation protein Maf [Ruminococcus sp.]|nr:septum formation protein Maf [Ruminococcus sp.]